MHRVGGIHSQEQADGGAGAASAGLWGDAASSAGSSSQCEEATGTPIFSATLRRAVIILHLAQRFFITTFFRFIYVCLFFFRNRRKKKRDRWMDSGMQGKCVLISNRFVLSVMVRKSGSLSIIFPL